MKYSIEYPQISGLDDEAIQNRINDTIRDEVLKVLAYWKHLHCRRMDHSSLSEDQMRRQMGPCHLKKSLPRWRKDQIR